MKMSLAFALRTGCIAALLVGCGQRDELAAWSGVVDRFVLSPAYRAFDPDWSSDGARLAVYGQEEFKTQSGRLYIVELESRDVVALGERTRVVDPNWLATEDLLVMGEYCKELLRWNATGAGEAEALTAGCAATWSPERETLVIYDADELAIVEYDPRTQRRELRLPLPNPSGYRVGGYASGIAASPGASQVVISLSAGVKPGNDLTDTDLYLVELDKQSVTPLVATRASETSPSWSPDGRWVVFVSHLEGADQSQIGFVDVETGCVKYPLAAGDVTGVDWSPIHLNLLAVTSRNALSVVDLSLAIPGFSEFDSQLCSPN